MPDTEIDSLEKDMDEGRVPFVAWNGDRFPVTYTLLKQFNLTSGQEISDETRRNINRYYAAKLREERGNA